MVVVEVTIPTVQLPLCTTLLAPVNLGALVVRTNCYRGHNPAHNKCFCVFVVSCCYLIFSREYIE